MSEQCTGILFEEPNPEREPPKESSREEGGDRGVTAARPTLTRNWGVAREFYLKNPTPNGSRPSGLIGLDRVGCWLACKRETEHLWFKATHSHEQHPRMF